MGEAMTFYAAYAFWLWIGLGAVLLGVEVLTGSGWLLWPAACAAVVAFAVQFGGLSLGQAALVYALITVAAVVLARRYLPRSLTHHGGRDINDATARLVGQQGQAVTDFSQRLGRVFVDGKEWSAELADGEALARGARVEVTGVSGACLQVRGA